MPLPALECEIRSSSSKVCAAGVTKVSSLASSPNDPSRLVSIPTVKSQDVEPVYVYVIFFSNDPTEFLTGCKICEFVRLL